MKKKKNYYHETVSKTLNSIVAERSSGELKVAKVAGEDASGHRHKVIDHVHEHRRSRQITQQLELDPSGAPDSDHTR